jgi:hypothetical protein
MLESPEYRAIMMDHERVSRRYFPAHYFAPADMRFANSAAIFPAAELSAKLEVEYRRPCDALC